MQSPPYHATITHAGQTYTVIVKVSKFVGRDEWLTAHTADWSTPFRNTPGYPSPWITARAERFTPIDIEECTCNGLEDIGCGVCRATARRVYASNF